MAGFNPFVLLLALASPVLAGVQEVWWNVTYVENANPDGLYPRQVIGVNNTWPPTPLSVEETDSLVLHVLNSLDVPTTVHHHGMYFNSSSWFDGALGVGQCGIPPGQSFDYVVPINTSTQIGTYWAHAHATGQYVDGLRTPLVIHATEEHYDYDEEYTVVISDWYHEQHSVLLSQFINIANPGGAEPIPDSALMYFAQNTSYLPPISGTNPTGPTSNVGFNENATLPFEAGKTYRLRLINMSGFVAFYFWIDGHNMTLIEADGTTIQEYPTDQIMLSVAQRYSVLVTARNDTSGSWAIHFNMDTTMLDTIPDDLTYNLTSSISYGSEVGTPTDLGPVESYNYMNDTLLSPVAVVAQLPPSSETVNLTFSFDTMNDGTNHALVNGMTYNTPLVPAVMSALSLGSNASVQSAYGPSSFVIDHLSVYDLLVRNSDTNTHPFHLHGHTFQIINIAAQYNATDDLSLNPPVQEGQANPMRRDTVMIPAGGSVTLRVVADNPGAWFFHCHIDWHLSSGLAVQIIEAPDVMQERAQGVVPQFMYDQCQTLGTPYQGNAAGHFSTTDLSGWYLGPWQQELGWLTKGILAMFGCVLTAFLGMVTVGWYSLGTQFTDEEVEDAVKARIEAKAKRGKLFGLIKPKQD